ncbi:protein takeout-like [Leptidea sinapis]|uniref:protein takeout-like n=1 Tax=Leptidea sinapis TaxID=189913 RepID=UPI002143F66E|nr:protein takeout-like [Leptidea sinapis]
MSALLIIKFVLVFCCVANADTDRSSVVTKCRASDSECMKESAQAILPKFALGLQQFNVETLDPITFDKIVADNPNLKLTLTNVKATGLKDCRVLRLERDSENTKIMTTLICDVNGVGHYEMKGQVVFVPLEGSGRIDVNLRKILVNVNLNMTVVEKKGTRYWKIKSWDHNFELKDKSSIHFENLFNGNKELVNAVEPVIKNSGNEMFLEVGPPVVKAVVSRIVGDVQKFFQSVPLHDLVLE